MIPQSVRRFLLKVGYACNNHCLFCHAAPHLGMDASTQAILEKIVVAQTMGAESIVLSGGEPTIRRDLPILVRQVRRHHMDIGLVTNGRMLVYEDLADLLVESRLDYIQLSLAAGRAEVHDAIVGVAGAFDQAVKGLERVLTQAQRPLELTISCVLTAPAIPTLDSLANLARRAARKAGTNHRIRLKISLLEIEGRAIEHARQLNAGLRKTADVLADFAERHRSKLEDDHVTLVQEGFPPCLSNLPIADLWTDGFVAMAEAFESQWHPIDDANRRRAPSCIDCSRDDCRGPYATTLERDAPGQLVPVTSKRPSSAPFGPLQTVFVRQPAHRDSCPIRDNTMPPGPPWSLWTRRKVDGTWAWTAWTPMSRDFGPREYRRFVSELEQVYGRSPRKKNDKSPADDRRRGPFANLVKYTKSSLCSDCPRRLTCLGLFEPSSRLRLDAVDRDADLLTERIRSLDGKLLDVGSGAHPPYLPALHKAIRQGRLRYLAVDPEASPDRTEFPIRVMEGRAEQLHEAFEQLGRPDWILSIRALPHYRQPSRFFEQARDILTAKGRLLVVSDEPFAVLVEGRPKQAGDKDWEHWRNPRFSDLLHALEEWGFEIEWSRPAGQDTSNLNFLVARPAGQNKKRNGTQKAD